MKKSILLFWLCVVAILIVVVRAQGETATDRINTIRLHREMIDLRLPHSNADYLVAFSLMSLAMVADYESTNYIIRSGGHELNPIARSFLFQRNGLLSRDRSYGFNLAAIGVMMIAFHLLRPHGAWKWLPVEVYAIPHFTAAGINVRLLL